MINPAKRQRVYVRSGLQTRQDRAVRFFGRVWNRTEPNRLSIPGPLADYRDRSLTLKYGNYTVIRSLLCITNMLAAFIGRRDSNMVTAPF